MSGPPRKPKKPTPTTKAYRFEGFATRLSKIKIDPVHTVQKSRVAEEQTDLSQSFFRSALDEWAELNLSATFTSFLNKASPLSESLPQLLHHSDAIFTLLHDHIKQEDMLALEPLLSLVAHLAHDLGAKFQTHFDSTVKLVAQVSASVEDPAAIECCFTCLAWIFKYLSRPLVQDLRPLLEIMIPYLSSKRDYVRRFSAESLAFLLRKSAMMYPKKDMPLRLAMSYLFNQFKENSSGDTSAYQKALMTLLSESAIGVDAQLHSSAVDLFRCVFELVGQFGYGERRILDAVDGTIVNLIHRTDAAGFKPLQDLIADVSRSPRRDETLHDTMTLRLLLNTSTTRRGSRVSNWQAVIEGLLAHLQQRQPSLNQAQDGLKDLIIVSAACLQYSPMDQLIPHVKAIHDAFATGPPQQFFAFCEMVADLGSQRFHDILLPRLQQYVVSQWPNGESGLCYFLDELQKRSVTSTKPGTKGYLACPSSWEQSIVQKLATSPRPVAFPEGSAMYFKLHESVHFPKEADSQALLKSTLEASLNDVLSQQQAKFEMPSRLTVGWAFDFYLSISELTEQQYAQLVPKIMTRRPEYYQLMPFLKCCVTVLNVASENLIIEQDFEKIGTALCSNMLSDSVLLREMTLQIILVIGKLQGREWLISSANLLLEIVQTKYLPSNARQLSMLIRHLPKQYELSSSSLEWQKLVPYFTIGMLRHYHDQNRKDLCVALGQMSADNKAEVLIIETATQWLQKPSILRQDDDSNSKPEASHKLTSFECSNVLLMQKTANDIVEKHHRAESHLRESFIETHSLHAAKTPVESRILALQIFLEAPEVAERRSRVLSPVFLSIQHGKANPHVAHSDESASSHTMSPSFGEQPWTLRERRMFLELLGKFVNPRVLYRSREIYESLLELLTNGNSEVRRLALLALLNWKDKSLEKYSDILVRIAEEKNATTELAQLLSSDEDDGSIEPQDRPNVLPILLRLVFGQLVGRSGTHGSQEAKRKSILRLLFRMQEHEISVFLEITLGCLGDVTVQEDGTFPRQYLDHDVLSQDQQYGFLRMILSVQEILESQFSPYGSKVVDAVLYCTVRACHQTNRLSDESNGNPESALVRNIRRSGIQCLTSIFVCCKDIDWHRYSRSIFNEVVSPRLPKFAVEVAQGVSSLLRLFSVWCKSLNLFHLLKRDSRLTENLWEILAVSSAREDVKTFVLEHILTPILELSSDSEGAPNAATQLLESEVEPIFQGLSAALQQQPSKNLLLAIAGVISSLAGFATSSKSTNDVLELLVTLFCEPSQRIPPHIKGRLLSATKSLVDIHRHDISSSTSTKLYDVVSSFYNYFKDQPNRVVLSEILEILAGDDSILQKTTRVCQDLNAVSEKHLGEIDYDRQLSAYNDINVLSIDRSRSEQWTPILYNLVFFSRTADEFSIRSNAVSSLKQFIVRACECPDPAIRDLVRQLILPLLRKGVKEDSELVRADFVAMFGMAVKHLPDAADLQDMKVLLVGDDEEASFFTNILHIQLHRRLRAIRRLLVEVERGAITASNISGVFLPLLEKFINDGSDDESAQGVKGHSIAAMSTLLQWVEWKSFRTSFRQYRSDLETLVRPEKDTIKLLGNAADALTSAVVQASTNVIETGNEPHLRTSLPVAQTIATELKTHFIPKFSKFIHHKDEAEISLRIPAAKVAVKLIKLLPAEEVPLLVAPIVLDIAQILRSRTQESRDIARNTLAEIVVLLGSSSVQFVLKEIRTALTRGYQLHVLSYTLHTILLQSASSRSPGDLDYCMEDLVSVVMDDIFGVVGQEKDNQDYISGMKEVKSSKSQDSMEILARCASVKHMSKLVTPFQALLTGGLNAKQIRQVDELFRRVGVGISHNVEASSRQLLIFAYELIQEFYRNKAAPQAPTLTNDEKNRQRFLVQLKSARETVNSTSSSLLYKIARFALDVVRSTLLRHSNLMTSENVHGFLPIIGDALVEAQEDVKISAIRLLSAIIKLPISELDKNASLYVMEAVKIVKGSINMNEEFPQAALKLVASILRERDDIQVRDSDIAYLLHRTMPDIEEPDRQGVTFNFIKAVMARQYQLPEVYELMDKVAVMMVTNQSRAGRDVARGVFVHFLLDYPQSKNRWAKQLKFMVKNLEYEHREGRQSMMEAMHLLVQKSRDETLKEVISSFFVPVILRIANDDDPGCRDMAGAMLSQLYRKADKSQLKRLLDPLRSWLEQTDNSSLTKLGFEAWTIYFDSDLADADSEIAAVRKAVTRTLQTDNPIDEDWELQYRALELYSRLVQQYPRIVLVQNQAKTWSAIRQLLLSREILVQISASKAVGLFFQSCVVNGLRATLPLTSEGGLGFEASAVLDLLRNSIKVVKRNEGDHDLAQQTTLNLWFLGNYIEAKDLPCKVKLHPFSDRAEPARDINGSESNSENPSDLEGGATRSITATQYLLDQLTSIVRREPGRLTTAAFTPRMTSLALLGKFISELAMDPFPHTTLVNLLTPLTYITDPSLQPPRSADPTFPDTYQSYVASAHELQEIIQKKFGDAVYVNLMTEVSKIVRERRGERRVKRAIDRVADPERTEREKQRKKEIKARRKKSLVDVHRKRRRGDLGF